LGNFRNPARNKRAGAKGTKGFFWKKMGPSRHIMRAKEKSKVAIFRDSSLQQGARLSEESKKANLAKSSCA